MDEKKSLSADDHNSPALRLEVSKRNLSFFLDTIIKARIALELETGSHDYDQEVNIYLAGLLHSLLSTGSQLVEKPYISACDSDVASYVDRHPSNSERFLVYKDNADFGFLALSVFFKIFHRGSYHDRVLHNTDDSVKIAFYYKMAANALDHVKHSRDVLGYTFYTLANNIHEYLTIVQKVAMDYFNFRESLSEGSIFHLHRELDSLERAAIYKGELENFLRLLTDYRKKPTGELKNEILAKIDTLKELKEDFSFDTATLEK